MATGMDGLRAAEISIALFESGLQRKTIRIEHLQGRFSCETNKKYSNARKLSVVVLLLPVILAI